MPNIAQLLKDEVSRLARKEVRAASAPLQQQIRELKKTNRQQREAIDLLLRRVDQLQALTISPADKILKAPSIGKDLQIRLSGTSIKKHRKRLGLSQGELGQLLNVSTNTIVRWEQDKSKPREAYRAGIAQLRTMGVREVKKLLASVE